MPLVTTQEIVDTAQVRGVGAGAFNVITLEHVEAAIEGAEVAGAPVILQISQNAVKFHRGQVLPLAAAAAASAAAARVPVALHLDHVDDPRLLHQAPAAGVSSVMFDGSRLDYDANVHATRAATEWGHTHGLHVEAELGEVGGKNGAHAPGVRTDPGEAADYVAATDVDSLAVAVGSTHAMTARTARLDYNLIRRLRDAVPVPLVLHGSSGVSDEQLRGAIAHGIVKVNVGTIVNVAFTNAVRKRLEDTALVDPRAYLGQARDAMSAAVSKLLQVLNGVDVVV